MKYPTMEEVEKADHKQLSRWYRFLPSPGRSAIGKSHEEFYKFLGQESLVLERIVLRFKDLGGWNPELSKEVGHES